MSNLVLSTECERSCSFCFARAVMSGSAPRLMAIEQVEDCLDAIVADGETEVRFIGGEPTQHPELARCVDAVERRGLRLVVFSNGLMPESAVSCLGDTDPERCAVVINLRPPHERGGRERRVLPRVLRRLGERVVLGATIDRLPFDLEYLVEEHEAADGRLAPFFRIGMALPLPGNLSAAPNPGQYPAVGRLLADLAETAGRRGVRLSFDCGFVRCQLDAAALEILDSYQAEVRFSCRPIPDIGPGPVAYHCLPAAGLWQLGLGTSEAEAPGLRVQRPSALRQRLAELRKAYDGFGIYRECSSCSALEAGVCDGGCLVHRMQRLRNVRCRDLEGMR